MNERVGTAYYCRKEGSVKIAKIGIVGLVVIAIVTLLTLAIVVAAVAANEPTAPTATQPGPIIQSGTAVIDPGGTDTGLAYVHLDFPDRPVLVVSLQTQIPVDYVAGIAFSDSLGAITIDLQEPTTQLVYINWVATMPTAARVEE